MTSRTVVAFGIAAVLVSGCYHATIETGLQPGSQTIHKPWAASWIYGLVPPSTVSAASECPSGVARVETQHSFLNQLVGFLTLGIFTPIEIKVTCAGAGSDGSATSDDVAVARAAEPAVYQAVFAAAAERAARTKQPVLVELVGALSTQRD